MEKQTTQVKCYTFVGNLSLKTCSAVNETQSRMGKWLNGWMDE